MKSSWPRWYQWSEAWAYRRLWLPELFAVVMVALGAIVLSEYPWGDRAVSGLFFNPASDHPWPLSQQAPWTWFNRYAGIGTALMAIGALGMIACSFFIDRLRRFRIHFLYIILVIALGPGIVVNLTLKEFWGRPRPKQVTEFGGWASYRSITNPAKLGRGKSFPCGHCSSSFALIALYFIARRRHPRLARLSLALALFLGGGMSAARVMSGAHFLSDALMSGAVVFLVAGFLYYAVLNVPAREDAQAPEAVCPGWPMLATAIALVALIAVGGALATPAHRTIRIENIAPPRAYDPVTLRLELEEASVHLRFGPYDRFAVYGFSTGFRGIGGSVDSDVMWTPSADAPTQLTFRLWRRGFFSEFRTAVTAHVPVVGFHGLRIAARNVQLALDEAPPPDLPIQVEMADGHINLTDAWNPLLDRFAITNTTIGRGPAEQTPPPDDCCP